MGGATKQSWSDDHETHKMTRKAGPYQDLQQGKICAGHNKMSATRFMIFRAVRVFRGSSTVEFSFDRARFRC